MAKPWWMAFTERYHPMRVWATAGQTSTLRFGIANGMSLAPLERSSASGPVTPGAKVAEIAG
jgi:hypothetical protein